MNAIIDQLKAKGQTVTEDEVRSACADLGVNPEAPTDEEIAAVVDIITSKNVSSLAGGGVGKVKKGGKLTSKPAALDTIKLNVTAATHPIIHHLDKYTDEEAQRILDLIQGVPGQVLQKLRAKLENTYEADPDRFRSEGESFVEEMFG